MLSGAIEKINNEMESNRSDEYVQVIGSFLLNYMKDNPSSAEKFADENKSIIKSLNEMKKAANTKRTGNYAILTPSEGFNAVLKYYGVEEAVNIPSIMDIGQSIKAVSKTDRRPAPKVDFDISLDDLL